MPTYTWCCQECENLYEIKNPIKDFEIPPFDKCPDCGGKLERGLHPLPQIGFKGKGRWQTHNIGGAR